MSKGKITPSNILHFNKKQKNTKKDVNNNEITIDNVVEKASSDNVSDALKNLYNKHGLIKGVKPISNKYKVSGFIKTVETSSYDWGTGIKAIYECQKDEILFIKCSDEDYAIWGELASSAAKKHGVKAVVVVGSSRDTADIIETDFPVFSKSIQSRAGKPLNEGTIGNPLFIDGVIVKDGDFLIADVDGVVIVSKDNLDNVIEEVNNIKSFESEAVRKLFDENERLDDIVGF